MPLKMVDQSRMLLAQERPLERGTHDKRGHGDGRVTGYDLQAERKGGERRRIPGCSTTFCVTTAGAGGGATVKPGDSVTVHATGTYFFKSEPGKQFWCTRDAGEPFKYVAGGGEVIRGWDQGVLGMEEGETREIHIPATEGYGNEGYPACDIPPNANLVFDIEVLQVRRSTELGRICGPGAQHVCVLM